MAKKKKRKKGIIEANLKTPKERTPDDQIDPEALEEMLRISGDVVGKTAPKIAGSIAYGGLPEAARAIFDVVDQKYVGASDMTRLIAGLGMLAQVSEVAKKYGLDELSEEDRVKALSAVVADQVKRGIESGKYDPKELLASAEQAKRLMREAGMWQDPPQDRGETP